MARTNKQISEELDKNLDEMEFLKADSDFLRGTMNVVNKNQNQHIVL